MEKFFKCPYCWEKIFMLLDESEPSQTFIEDCEVCCNPIQITYSLKDNDNDRGNENGDESAENTFSAVRIQ
jgi:hypothetical protein